MSKRSIATRIVTPHGVYEPGKEVAVAVRTLVADDNHPGQSKVQEVVVKGVIEVLYTDGWCLVKYEDGVSEFNTPRYNQVGARIRDVLLRDQTIQSVWDKIGAKTEAQEAAS